MSEESGQLHGGRLLVEVSNRVVGLVRDFSGKGPSACKSYWAGPDLLVIVLRGGFTLAEQTLFEGGRGGSVRDSRHALQDTLQARLSTMITELTGRGVDAFLSASHQEPDLRVELFLLTPLGPDPETATETDDLLS